MNSNHDMTAVIETAFAEAEAGIDLNDFIVEFERRRKKRHMIRWFAMTMAVAAGGYVTMLFAGDAIATVSRRFVFDTGSPAGLFACILPLVVAAAVTDVLFLHARGRQHAI
jgi:hypothetical protein